VLQEKKRPRIIEAILYITDQIKWVDIHPSWPTGENPSGELKQSKKRGIQRQNETMLFLASLGYKVVALKEILGGNGYGLSPNANPDCLVEGHVFEIYAPDAYTNIDGIITKVNRKSQKQSPNILLNLNDYQGDVNVLISNIKRQRHPKGSLKHLGILLIILDGKIINVFE